MKEVEDLRKKLAEEKKERNDKHVAHRNDMAILRAENEDLKRRLFSQLNATKGPEISAPIVLAPQVAAAPIPAVPPPAPPPPESIPQASPEPDPMDEPEEEDDGDISGPLTAPLTEKQVQNLWVDIARNVMQRVKRLAFKNPDRKKELDTMTFFLNKQYEEDRARAEIELFGGELANEAWDNMSEEEYYEKIYQIDVFVERLVRERLEEEPAADGGKKKKR